MEYLFPSFIDQYIDELAKKGRKDSTIQRYMYDLNDFAYWLHKARSTTEYINWKSITKDELDLFFHVLSEERKYNVRTIRRIHSVLKQVYQYRKSLGQSELSPIQEIIPPELHSGPLQESEWVDQNEQRQLLSTLSSKNGLSEQQLEMFSFYKERNEFIVRLFLHYGLTLHEVQQLSMNDLRFERNEIHIQEDNRIILLKENDKQLAYTYFKAIPEPVRPRFYSQDPFFVSFDFKRKTFHWSYDDDEPKRMSPIAIQKMVRMEVKRAKLRKGISAQTLRNTFILTTLLHGESSDELVQRIGYTTPLSMNRYKNTIDSITEKQKQRLLAGIL
ncbi:phage integrase N-terminal SAM-like domain-containing protein [Alkalihalobacillus sp. MEB130]|uniref:tyrosine-type recombinase/integrase n=1 Tax=Alkalihalobacillus sp. MEB130 TaxID=2976704 RepID=UPI0028DF60F6|nr:site-specific integrase [Alkalihalobacillus sp. MEB130]MDT8862853.1 phage integrase N-terminal SAM-like domain-containing protein [Alkalihalobacillus sp. MEB130]